MGVIIPVLLVIICCLIIWRASDGFSVATEYLGRKLSEGVRGATLNAIGSSLPELFTTFFFLFYLKNVDGFSGGIGTTAGSAIFNGMIIPAFSILVVVLTGMSKKIRVTRKVLMRDGLALIMAELLFIVIISGTALHWWHGLVLMIIYFIYVAYMFRSMKPRKFEGMPYLAESPVSPGGAGSTFSRLKAAASFDLAHAVLGGRNLTSGRAWWLLFVSVLVFAGTCHLLVQACDWIGRDEYHLPLIGSLRGLDIPIMFVAVILASAATSVPDTIISMNDARKGNYDDAISNALGSNIFDICFALGLPLFLYTLLYGPIQMNPETIQQSSELRMLLLILTILAFIVYTSRTTIGYYQAYILLGLYAFFTLYVIGRSAGHPLAGYVADQLSAMIRFLNIL
jgi:Ca2+/Na+ antiporter